MEEAVRHMRHQAKTEPASWARRQGKRKDRAISELDRKRARNLTESKRRDERRRRDSRSAEDNKLADEARGPSGRSDASRLERAERRSRHSSSSNSSSCSMGRRHMGDPAAVPRRCHGQEERTPLKPSAGRDKRDQGDVSTAATATTTTSTAATTTKASRRINESEAPVPLELLESISERALDYAKQLGLFDEFRVKLLQEIQQLDQFQQIRHRFQLEVERFCASERTSLAESRAKLRQQLADQCSRGQFESTNKLAEPIERVLAQWDGSELVESYRNKLADCPQIRNLQQRARELEPPPASLAGRRSEPAAAAAATAHVNIQLPDSVLIPTPSPSVSPFQTPPTPAKLRETAPTSSPAPAPAPALAPPPPPAQAPQAKAADKSRLELGPLGRVVPRGEAGLGGVAGGLANKRRSKKKNGRQKRKKKRRERREGLEWQGRGRNSSGHHGQDWRERNPSEPRPARARTPPPPPPPSPLPLPPPRPSSSTRSGTGSRLVRCARPTSPARSRCRSDQTTATTTAAAAAARWEVAVER